MKCICLEKCSTLNSGFCLGFKIPNPKSHFSQTKHTHRENNTKYVVGIFITKSGLGLHSNQVAVAPFFFFLYIFLLFFCGALFSLCQTPDAFWHCFLLFFMIICIHQFCIDSMLLTPCQKFPSSKSTKSSERINIYKHTYIYSMYRSWQKAMNSDVLTLGTASAFCQFANSILRIYEL